MARAAHAISLNGKKPELNKKQKGDTQFSHIQPEGSWEIPRKLYHYSIGFLVLTLFLYGYDTKTIYPPLSAFLSLVLAGEFLRFQFEWFNVLYCKILGPLMRQSEVSTRFNGVVYYLAGCIIVLYGFPRDIAALSIIYLSWTDPTASICGRLWGRHTPRYGNKSLAGSLGAWITGSMVTYFFFKTWQYCSLSSSSFPRSSPVMAFPTSYDPNTSHMPLWFVALYGGFVSAFSEFIGDCLGLDDNLTIPVVSACLLWIPFIGLGLSH